VDHPSIRLPSFAKINWSLQILGKRPDGYHEVRTTLQTISLHDDLHFELSPDQDISLACDDPQIPKGIENLIILAAEALRDHYQVSGGARIHLHKSIPTQAGLGGASSNAAVTLLALKRLWNVAASMEELAEIASSLGADVPFFLLGGRALATGTGTVVSKLPDEENIQLIVIDPRASVSTADAYQALNSPALTSNNSIPILSSSLEEANSRSSKLWSLRELKNDFESVIFDMEPEIERAKMSLLAAGAQGALLAGSGSSVFGIFADREAQQRALNEIKVDPGWRVFACATVSRIEYARALRL
jgi:4-diphosphocytidyl-2-C-methyl-D-erythritol kinase